MEYRTLYWEDVEEGQELPAITYELSLLRLVAMVRASGLYDYVHFDRDYAQAVGARDVFIATHHVAGLFGRLLTDWTGPDADIRSLTFSMNAQSCVNDILTITGRVGRKYRGEQGEYLVDMADLNMAHQFSPKAASATATMVLPSRAGGAVKVLGGVSRLPKVEPDPNMPDFAKACLGKVKEGMREPARPLTEDEIHLWCECIEDWNPLYWDKDFASKSRYGGIISPPPAIFFGAGSSAHMGIGYLKPGEKVPAAVQKGLTGLPLLQELRKNMMAGNIPLTPPGCPEVAIAQARTDYFSPLRPGDSGQSRQEILNCSPMKRTKLGEGHFLTWMNSVYNQREELVRTFTLTGFFYHV
ncbi:MAG: hypothetical protein WAO76_09245 [Georgfuchsia sp.]